MMNFIILLTSIYAFIEIIVVGYIEYKDNNNKAAGIVLFVLSALCLVLPNLVML